MVAQTSLRKWAAAAKQVNMRVPLHLTVAALIACPAPTSKAAAIDSEAEIVSRAYDIVGMSQVSAIAPPHLTRDTGTGDETPFLHHWINGQPVCRIALPWYDDCIGMEPDSMMSASVQKKKNGEMEVILDSAGTRVLKVIVRRDSLRQSEDIAVVADSAEKQLFYSREKYLDFPAHLPHTPLFQALAACPRDPASARQIEARYVTYSWRDNTPREVWVIELRGMPPGPVHGPGASQVPLYQRNHVRIIVDDKSGKASMCTNIPQVPLKPDDPFKKAIDLIMGRGR